MPLSRFVSVLVLLASSHCGYGLRSFDARVGRGDERRLWWTSTRSRRTVDWPYPTDFSRSANPSKILKGCSRASLPSQAEIESLMFTLDPAARAGGLRADDGGHRRGAGLPAHRPHRGERVQWRRVNKRSISPQTNAAGSLFPLDSSTVMPLVPGVQPVSTDRCGHASRIGPCSANGLLARSVGGASVEGVALS